MASSYKLKSLIIFTKFFRDFSEPSLNDFRRLYADVLIDDEAIDAQSFENFYEFTRGSHVGDSSDFDDIICKQSIGKVSCNEEHKNSFQASKM